MRGIYSFIPFTEGGGPPIDYACAPPYANNSLTVNSGATWGLGAGGVQCGVVTGGANFATPNSWALTLLSNPGDTLSAPTADFTFRMVFTPNWSANFTVPCDDANRNLSLFFDTNGNYDFLTISNTINGANGSSVTGLNMASGQRWDHVLVGQGGTLYFYVNGYRQATLAGGSRTTVVAPVNTQFGANPSTGGATFSGKYELIQAWKRPLQADEISYLYNDPYAGLTFPQDDILAELVGVAAAASGHTPIPRWQRIVE